MNNLPKENKVLWIDNLRVTATIAVVVLHVCAYPAAHYGSISPLDWWIGNICDSSVRFCVPIFVMLTGALLLPHYQPIESYLNKRMSKIMLPFIFWSIIYIIYTLTSTGLYLRLTPTGIVSYLLTSFQHGSYFHLWYIYMIIGLYLVIPIIGAWIRNAREKEILYFLLIWLVSLFINQPIISTFKPNIDLSYFTGYIGYLVLGHYIATKTFNNLALTKLIATISLLAGILSTILATFIASHFKGGFIDIFYNYLTPNIMVVSSSLFILFRHSDNNKKTILWKPATVMISRYSYGIYLVHVLVLDFLAKARIDWNFINPLVGIPLTSACCIGISIGIIYLLNRIPYGRYIAG